MKVHELTPDNRREYDKFVESHSLGSIHQAFEWGEFQVKLSGRDKSWCFAVENEKGKILASALVIRQVLPLKKSWLYCPRGPLADYTESSGPTAPSGSSDEKTSEALQLIFTKIQQLAKSQNAVFLRFDPPVLQGEKVDLAPYKARPSHAHYQPENTLILDLILTEEELLKQMKPKGRYNIKVAQKHEVKIRVSENSQQDIDSFYKLLGQTTTRDDFSGHNKKYYEDMLVTLGHKKARLYLAEYGGKIVAGIIVTTFKDTATYYFGASSNEHRNTMAPYLLQWQAIVDAKKAGCKYYDFLGIAPSLPNSPDGIDRSHPWSGVTDFKLKFGGKRVDYLPAQEIVYRPFWYAVIKLLKKFRK